MTEEALPGRITPHSTALLIGDLQNDFLDARGAYGRAGQTSRHIAPIADRVHAVASRLKQAGGMVVASRFTLWPDQHGQPMIQPHLKQLRPFLGGSDFAPGSWGHSVVDNLKPLVDVAVDKVAYSSFFNTQLEWVLRHAGINTLLVTGIVTQGGVASTVRDAHLREFDTIIPGDACASFRVAQHDAALTDLASIATVCQCDEVLGALS